MLFLTHCCIYTFWLQSLSLTALPWPPPSQSPFPHTFPLLFLKFSSASFNLKNEVPWSSSYFFIYSCLFFSSLLGCIILSIILSLNGISMLFWCFTCNSLVFLPFYTWVLGSLINFKCVIWFILLLLCTIIAISSQEHLVHIRSSLWQDQIFCISSHIIFFSCCFPVITFFIWTCSLTISSLSQLQTRAYYFSAFHNAQEAIMNLAMSCIFLKFFQII